MRLVGRRDLEASGGGRDLCGSAHREGAMIEPTPLPALPPPLGPPLWQGRSSVMQVWGSDLKWTPSTLLPKGNSAIQKMESFFSLKSIIATLLRSSSTSWLTDIILAFLCGLGLFLLLLPCLQSNPYLPPSRKHRNIRKVRNLCLNPKRDYLFFSNSYIHFFFQVRETFFFSFHIWYYTCFNAILPNHPTLSLSHRVQNTVLYISVPFVVSYTGLLLPSF